MIGNGIQLDADLSVPPPGFATGLIEVPEGLMRGSNLQTFATARPGLMVPRAEWKSRSQRLAKQYRDDVTQIYSQGQIASCVGFGAAQILETTLRRRYGKPNWVSLCGLSIYKQIANNPNSGAMVDDGMDAVLKGCLPTDTAENKAKYSITHPLRDWSTKLPSNWLETGMLFRGMRFAVARGIDMIASALINGYCGIVGRQQHCIPYVYLDFQGDIPVFPYANSWDKTWGDEGFGYDSERIVRDITCWILLDVVTRPDLEVPDLA